MTMIGKIISQLLGGGECEDRGDELLEDEEGGWVIVNLSDVGPLSSPVGSEALEKLLLEQPSISVYQMRRSMSAVDHHDDDEEEEESSDEDEENVSSRPVALSSSFRRGRVSWRLAAWGVPLPAHVLRLASGRDVMAAAERKKRSRGALLRQNLTTVKTRERHVYAHIKQPGSRPYNY